MMVAAGKGGLWFVSSPYFCSLQLLLPYNLLSSVQASRSFGFSPVLISGCVHSCLSGSCCFCFVWTANLIPQAEQVNT